MAHSAKNRAVVIGSGPNGLTAAILLARAGWEVVVHEAASEAGGGMRSSELTLPGFLHDVCSAIHPMGISSPVFEQFPLAEYGLEWIQPGVPVAHPLDDGTAVLLHQSIPATAANLEQDGDAWRRLFHPLAADWPKLRHDVLAPPLGVPRHPLMMARFGLLGIQSAQALADSRFTGTRARALFAGIAAHSVLPLGERLSAAIGLALATCGHSYGWPLPRGGSGRIAGALCGYLRSLGGEIRTGSMVETLPDAPLVMCDIGPRQLVQLAGDRLPPGFRRSLESFRYGPGVFKVDWALDGPIPWRARDCSRAATVHVGGTFEEIAQWEARHEGRPFVLVTQPSLFDPSRAPAGLHTAWGYCHVPNGSTADMTDAIEFQVERFAPGFRRSILSRCVSTPADLERRNPNLVGGDITGGISDLAQVFLRPTRMGYKTPLDGVYLCSASTPPGGAVHGMCGYHAVRAAL